MRVIFQFEKKGAARFISHLDVLRSMQRAMRRARIPVAYSQGFNPHMLLSFATALSLGAESTAELLDIKLTQMVDLDEMLEALNRAFPAGFKAVRARVADEKEPKLTKEMKWAGYTVTLSSDISDKVRDFLSMESCIVTKKSKRGLKEVDIRPMVRHLKVIENGAVEMILDCTDSSALSPELLLATMGVEETPAILRTALYGQNEDGLTDLFDGGSVK